jgi:hypothetical protein
MFSMSWATEFYKFYKFFFVGYKTAMPFNRFPSPDAIKRHSTPCRRRKWFETMLCLNRQGSMLNDFTQVVDNRTTLHHCVHNVQV